MQTQWSTGANDGISDVGVGGGPMPVGPEGAADDAVRETDGESIGVPATAVDWSTAGGAGADDVLDEAAADGTEGEEEAHRWAVDAVDGLLDEVELALARLDDGTYGRCEECGAPIDDARLAGSPIERTCGSCVIGGSGTAVEAASGATGTTVAPVGLTAATGLHGG